MMVSEDTESEPRSLRPRTLRDVFQRGPILEHVYEVEWTHLGAYAQVRLSNGTKRSAFVPIEAVRAVRSGDVSYSKAVPTDGGRPLGRTGRELATWLAGHRTTAQLDELETEILAIPPDLFAEDLRAVDLAPISSGNALRWLALGVSAALFALSFALLGTLLYLAV